MNILIGVTGGIAAYKIPSLVRLLTKRGHQVKLVLSPAARPLVSEDVLRTLSGNNVYTDVVSPEYTMGHIALDEWADLYLIAPATANTISALACARGDNLLTTLALSVQAPLLLAPAMNVNMWNHCGVQANLDTLRTRDAVHVLPVGAGELACGVVGQGRMLEVAEIAEYCELARADLVSLKGRTVLITSGPTREPIDAVRCITNRSSGAMGASLARAALLAGAHVVFVTGPAAVSPPGGVEVIRCETAQDMYGAVMERIRATDIFVMAAAVGDFAVVDADRSVKKSLKGERDVRTLRLRENPDIAAAVGERKTAEQLLITFSLESGGIDRAVLKMHRKKADFTAYNHIDDVMEKSRATFRILSAKKDDVIGECRDVSKIRAAATILRSMFS
ncbi:MAG: bifunctional phosphopantothenoylcysteine decarboxylase/phosphopantothenate--cysteine ligase CoaBC [Fibrobacterota bacterium]